MSYPLSVNWAESEGGAGTEQVSNGVRFKGGAKTKSAPTRRRCVIDLSAADIANLSREIFREEGLGAGA